MNPSPQKILIIRFSSIGDIVLTTPVPRCLKNSFPDAQIHFLTKPAFAPILQSNPHINQVHVLNKSLTETGKILRSENFDLVVDLHSNLRTLLIKSILDKPSVAFDKLNPEKTITVLTHKKVLPPVHIVDRYLQTVEHLGVVNDGKGLDYYIPDSDQINQAEGFSLTDTPYYTWAIGAQHFTKRLPPNRIQKHIQELPFPVLLLGGKDDIETGEQIANASNGKAINLCGKLSLHQSARVVQLSAKLFTNDTGLMHIAAALKVPVVSFWGNTIPEFGMTPYYGSLNVPSEIIENREISCRPCSKIGYAQCPKKHFNCMNQL